MPFVKPLAAPNADGSVPWRAAPDGLRVHVRLTPKGGKDALEGVARRDDEKAYVKARVRAAPEDGAANAALVKLVAKTLRVPTSSVRVEAGHAARVKTLFISGDAPALAQALTEALPAPS